MLARYGHIEQIPLNVGDWDIKVRGAAKLAATLADELDHALLFRRIATVEVDAPVSTSVDEIAWRGPQPELVAICEDIDAMGLAERAVALAESRG